jgi:hypothetical protein
VKKFGLHLDALIAIIVVFILACGMILYQRHQFSGLLQESIDLAWENETLKMDVEYQTGLLDKCNSNKNSEDEDETGNEQTSTTD